MHSQSFPENYGQLVRTARAATQSALADGHKLIEIDFPTYSLAAVAGEQQHPRRATFLILMPRSQLTSGKNITLGAPISAGRCFC